MEKYCEFEETCTGYCGSLAYGFYYKFSNNLVAYLYADNLAETIDLLEQVTNYEKNNGSYNDKLVSNFFGSFEFSVSLNGDMWCFSPLSGSGTPKDGLICSVIFEITNDELRKFFTDSVDRLINKYHVANQTNENVTSK
jgi:hypothetical protein